MKKEAEQKKMTEKEKVEERREEVLARGRKFKYPLQYAKHRLMINTIIVVVVAMVVAAGTFWWALYKLQTTSDLAYRLTTVIPVPVAQVDGESVRYSDYLLLYRSSIAPVTQQQGPLSSNADSEELVKMYKRVALSEAEEYTYAIKLAREEGVTVSNEDVDAAILEHRKVGGVERSEESFAKVVKDNFGLSMDEYRRLVYLMLVKTKVAEKIDTAALETATKVKEMIEKGESLKKIAGELGEKVQYEETGALVDRMNVDGGRATVAMMLSDGDVSERFTSANGDGWYFVQLNEKNDTQVNYVSIKIVFTEFKDRFSKVEVKEKIELEADEPDESDDETNGEMDEE